MPPSRIPVIWIWRRPLCKRYEELKNKQQVIEELNTTLKVLLKKREEEHKELEKKVLTNVKHLIEPTLEKLKRSQSSQNQKVFIDILESNLKEIISLVIINIVLALILGNSFSQKKMFQSLFKLQIIMILNYNYHF